MYTHIHIYWDSFTLFKIIHYYFWALFANTDIISASGRKLSVPGKRITGTPLSKSQTLPRSMGRSMPIQSCHRTMPIKPSSTPPSVKRQLSVPSNGSPIRRPGTPTTSNSNRSTPTRKVPVLKGVDQKLTQVILDEILEGGAPVQWEDIAGQEVHFPSSLPSFPFPFTLFFLLPFSLSQSNYFPCLDWLNW